jgi:hypothetical protein
MGQTRIPGLSRQPLPILPHTQHVDDLLIQTQPLMFHGHIQRWKMEHVHIAASGRVLFLAQQKHPTRLNRHRMQDMNIGGSCGGTDL